VAAARAAGFGRPALGDTFENQRKAYALLLAVALLLLTEHDAQFSK
jgi:hypothetical protein